MSLFSWGPCFTSDPLPPGSPRAPSLWLLSVDSQCTEIALCLDHVLEVRTTQSGLSYLIICYSRHFVSPSTTFYTVSHQLLETVHSWASLECYLPLRGSRALPSICFSHLCVLASLKALSLAPALVSTCSQRVTTLRI